MSLWSLFRRIKIWPEHRHHTEKFQLLVSKLSIARQNAVSHRNNFLTDRNLIWFCGKNLGDSLLLIKCSTVPPLRNKWKNYPTRLDYIFYFIQRPGMKGFKEIFSLLRNLQIFTLRIVSTPIEYIVLVLDYLIQNNIAKKCLSIQQVA